MDQVSIHNCPACGRAIDSKRLFLDMVVCECGWTRSQRCQQAEKRRDLWTAVTLVSIAVALVLSFIHIVRWDKFAFEVVSLTAKEYLALATTPDLERKVFICRERLNHECVAHTLARLVLRHPKKLSYFAELGKIQAQLLNWNQAQTSFQRYIELGGREHEIVYELAKVYSALGQVDLASKYFDMTLSIKPDVLQIQVVRVYVSMLMGFGRYTQAQDLIYRVRKSGVNAAYFLDAELREIQRKTATHES